MKQRQTRLSLHSSQIMLPQVKGSTRLVFQCKAPRSTSSSYAVVNVLAVGGRKGQSPAKQAANSM
jgi:hypothetical protein